MTEAGPAFGATQSSPDRHARTAGSRQGASSARGCTHRESRAGNDWLTPPPFAHDEGSEPAWGSGSTMWGTSKCVGVKWGPLVRWRQRVLTCGRCGG